MPRVNKRLEEHNIYVREKERAGKYEVRVSGPPGRSGGAAYPNAKRYFKGLGRAHALGTLLPLPLRVYEASQALIYTCMTTVLMRSARFFSQASYARLHVSSVRIPDDATGAA